MYIRWKTRKHKWSSLNDLISLYLVTNERRDGKPRQKVQFLISSQRWRLDNSVSQEFFWNSLRRKLDELVPDDELYERLCAKIATIVPDRRSDWYNLVNDPKSEQVLPSNVSTCPEG